MSATVIHLEKVRMCDFCGKTEKQVTELIVAPGGYADICNECVEVCQQVIEDSRKRQQTPVDTAASLDTGQPRVNNGAGC